MKKTRKVDNDRAIEDGPHIDLMVIHLRECAPSKCTGLKMARMGMARNARSIQEVRKGAIVLVPSPHARHTISPLDRELAIKKGIVALDCSWRKAEGDSGTFEAIGPMLGRRGAETRSLPFLMPVNPINYGHAFMLSTLEAFAAALFIIGNRGQAMEVLEIYKWAPHFLEMNKEPLSDYAGAKDSKEVVALQSRYV